MNTWLGTFVWVAVGCACLSTARAGDLQLADLVADVRAAEQLYAGCDVTFRMTYGMAKDPPEQPAGNGVWRIVSKMDTDVHLVLQQGMMHLEAEVASRHSSAEEEQTYRRTRLYDGETSRAVQGKLMNIAEGPTPDDNVLRPHMMLIQDMSFPIPLSVFMQGDKAMQADPGGAYASPARSHECEFLGEEEWDGHPCFKIALLSISKKTGKVWDRMIVWLAADRNYIPIRYVSYAYKWSEEFPYNEGTVLEFAEVTPGVWFPMKASIVMYEHFVLKNEGRQEVKATRRYEVSSVSLDPNYPIEFFRDLPMPDDTATGHVDSARNRGGGS